MAMLNLGNDVLTHNVFPYLNFKDILSLRLVCKYLYGLVESSDDWKWDRRYYEDFSYDERRLDGNGFERYVRRCKARLIFDDSHRYSKYYNMSLNVALQQEIASEPIVDLVHFHMDCPDGFEGEGVLVRRLNNSIVAYTSQGVRCLIDTTGVSRIWTVGWATFDEYQETYVHFILGWKDGQVVKYDLDELGIRRDIAESGDGELLKREVVKRTTLSSSPLAWRLSDEKRELFEKFDRRQDAHLPRRLTEPAFSLKYYSFYMDFIYAYHHFQMQDPDDISDRFTGHTDLFDHLLEGNPPRLDVGIAQVWHYNENLYSLAVAATSGDTVHVSAGLHPQDPLAESHFDKLRRIHSVRFKFKFPHKIKMVCGGDQFYALDVKGNVYGDWFSYERGEKRGGERDLQRLLVAEPKLLWTGAASMLDSYGRSELSTVLMLDGTVKSIGKGPPKDSNVENAILLGGPVILVSN